MTIYEAEVSFMTARRSGWRTSAFVTLACLIAAVPIFLSPLPPVMDFPNHLTRIWLLGEGTRFAPLSAIYEARWWQASTNVAVDFVGSLLVRAAGLAATAKILLALMLIGPPLGAAFLNRAHYGRFHVWQLAGVMLVWCTTAVEGFLSFQIGLAAALCCAALVLPVLDRLTPLRLVGVLALAAALLLIHPFAVVFFGTLMGGLVLGNRLPPLRVLVRERALRLFALAVACVLPLIVMFLLAPDPPGVHTAGSHLAHWEPASVTFSPKNIFLLTLSPFISYRILLDLVFIAALAAVMVWGAMWGRLRIHAGLFVAAVAFLVIAPFLPTNIGDGGALPIRFPIMAALMLLAGTRLEFEKSRAASLLTAALVLIALGRVGSIAWVWHMRSNDVRQFEEATRELPSGASVMVLQEKWTDTSKVPVGRLVAACPFNVCASERHFGSLAVMWRHVFIPTLFTVPGQQPLGVKAPWASKAVFASGIPNASDITSHKALLHDPYLKNWRDRFDYVLVLDADLAHTRLPHVAPVSDTGFARLYRVVHG